MRLRGDDLQKLLIYAHFVFVSEFNFSFLFACLLAIQRGPRTAAPDDITSSSVFSPRDYGSNYARRVSTNRLHAENYWPRRMIGSWAIGTRHQLSLRREKIVSIKQITFNVMRRWLHCDRSLAAQFEQFTIIDGMSSQFIPPIKGRHCGNLETLPESSSTGRRKSSSIIIQIKLRRWELTR